MGKVQVILINRDVGVLRDSGPHSDSGNLVVQLVGDVIEIFNALHIHVGGNDQTGYPIPEGCAEVFKLIAILIPVIGVSVRQPSIQEKILISVSQRSIDDPRIRLGEVHIVAHLVFENRCNQICHSDPFRPIRIGNLHGIGSRSSRNQSGGENRSYGFYLIHSVFSWF